MAQGRRKKRKGGQDYSLTLFEASDSHLTSSDDENFGKDPYAQILKVAWKSTEERERKQVFRIDRTTGAVPYLQDGTSSGGKEASKHLAYQPSACGKPQAVSMLTNPCTSLEDRRNRGKVVYLDSCKREVDGTHAPVEEGSQGAARRELGGHSGG